MGGLSLFLLACGLAADAFAVAVTDGLCHRTLRGRGAVAIGLCFGLMQGAMPAAGYLLGLRFAGYITAFDHLIALVLLSFIGGRMLVEALRGGDTDNEVAVLTPAALLLQGVATSIDALAVGIGLAALPDVSIARAAAVICGVTFCLSLGGVYIGKRFGARFNRRAQLIGGAVLVGIGVKIFLEHTVFA